MRRGFYARVRVEDHGAGRIRPHERTQPGPKEDRLRLTRATRHNLSAIFSLTDGNAWPHLEPETTGEPWAEVTDADGTVHRVWRVTDPEIHEAVHLELADSELLIADGHHRYETARLYAQEIPGDGPHHYTLMNLVSLEDPGLTVFPTHRLLTGLDAQSAAALQQGIAERFEITPVETAQALPADEEGVGVFGLLDGSGRARRLRLRDPELAATALSGRSAAHQRLDAAILEQLVLIDILGMTAAGVEAKRGITYAKSVADVHGMLAAGRADVAFLLRATPVSQVREIAAAGETMPPKSTYFFPKLLTGLVFNPLS
ncbi:MAG: DUF1015 family protein [Solirubrobacterales bacterium]